MKITFTNISNTSLKYGPKPASSVVPNWYKEMNSYLDGEKKPISSEKSQTSGTIKRCMPVFDIITAGYILFTQVDVWVSQKDGQPFYQWPSSPGLEFHSIEQAPSYPNNTGHTLCYPKWMNPWAIKTSKGTSVLFTKPFHRESIFSILEGIVDTDEYNLPVNFPFVLNNPSYEGLIPAGTPMAQVIPFKRDNWEMSLGDEKELNEIKNSFSVLNSKFFDRYKNLFRQNKTYK